MCDASNLRISETADHNRDNPIETFCSTLKQPILAAISAPLALLIIIFLKIIEKKTHYVIIWLSLINNGSSINSSSADYCQVKTWLNMAEPLILQHSTSERKEGAWTRPEALTSIVPHTLGQVSEVLVLDSQCGVLVHKRSLHNIPYRQVQQLFAKHMKAVGHKTLSPYFRDENIDFFYLSKNDVYLVAAHPASDTDTAVSVVIYLDFLQRLYDILKDCIGTVNEPYVAVNRMLVFELLDEMLSAGYSFVASYADLKAHLTLEPIRPKIVPQDELASRFFGIYTADKSRVQTGSSQTKHKSPNSVYLNIVEGLSAVLGLNGEVSSSELWGKLTLISTLERPSSILIQLNPDLVIRNSGAAQGQVAGATHVENPSFHSCVDTSQLIKNKLLRVFPPPDQTRLMMYTLSDSACIHIPILVVPSLVPVDGSRDQNLKLRLINQADSQATASYIRVKVKLPHSVASVATTKHGEQTGQSSTFVPPEKLVEWEIKRSTGGSEAAITFRLILNTDKSLELADIGPISVGFNLTNFSASGLMVKVARVEGNTDTDATPECYFGVSTKAASYTVRTDAAKELSVS